MAAPKLVHYIVNRDAYSNTAISTVLQKPLAIFYRGVVVVVVVVSGLELSNSGIFYFTSPVTAALVTLDILGKEVQR